MVAMDADYYREIETALMALLNELAAVLAAKQLVELRELVDHHGEYGLALEMLSFALTKSGTPISRDVLERIVALDTRMGHSEPIDIEKLKVLVKD